MQIHRGDTRFNFAFAHRNRAAMAGIAALALFAVAMLGSIVYLWQVARQFPREPFKQPSRLYARATVLEAGRPFSQKALVAELEDAGYAATAGPGPLAQGTYRSVPGRVAVFLHRFPTPEGPAGGVPAEVAFAGGSVRRLRLAGRAVETLALEPPLLASYYGPDDEERRPVRLDDLPEETVQAVLAAEDDGFYIHPGVSPAGIVRAAWVNLRGGAVAQGGSTITQQLVKNVYLSPKRTLARKAREALLAVVLEARYGKRAILEAYLNEIYWGRSGSANLVGLGAAARAYFGKDAAALTLEEAATLAGMIRAPADYSPVDDAAAACERRDFVLRRMGELGWLTAERMERAIAQPLKVSPQPVVARRAPYLAAVAAAEARERFDVDDLEGEGYALFSTVSLAEQRLAERTVATGIAAAERGWERKPRTDDPLQAALISVDPRDGSILAYVGGRDYAESQFDRVANARRQAGSAFKPVVYAAAFGESVALPSTPIKDSPIVVRAEGASWRPQNNDRAFHGMVTARAALEQSLNIPTVRLALQVGLGRILRLARELGIEGRIAPVPAVALGAFEVTPRELATVYATLAAGGNRPELHALALVQDRGGEAVLGEEPPAPRRVIHPQTAYLVTSVLQGVLDRGTGAGARGQGVRGELAGKTGTTNGRRDNWFAGYSPDRATVVWVGYDDNSRTRLSGARGALPIWARFTSAVRPAGGYLRFEPPPGIVTATVDPESGELATPYCPQAVAEVFPEWQMPGQPCRIHSPAYASPWQEAGLQPGLDAGLAGGEVPLDPMTGQPLPGWAVAGRAPEGAEPRLEVTVSGDPGEEELAPQPAFQPVPSPPVRRPAPAVVARVPRPQQPAEEPGTIEIHPSRAGEPQPVEIDPEPAPGAGNVELADPQPVPEIPEGPANLPSEAPADPAQPTPVPASPPPLW